MIRKSGTEPVIRLMAQGEDQVLLASVVDDICEAILAEMARIAWAVQAKGEVYRAPAVGA